MFIISTERDIYLYVMSVLIKLVLYRGGVFPVGGGVGGGDGDYLSRTLCRPCLAFLELCSWWYKYNIHSRSREMPDPPINPKNFGIGIPNPIGPAVFSALERPR